jgi:hypothetical protein
MGPWFIPPRRNRPIVRSAKRCRHCILCLLYAYLRLDPNSYGLYSVHCTLRKILGLYCSFELAEYSKTKIHQRHLFADLTYNTSSLLFTQSKLGDPRNSVDTIFRRNSYFCTSVDIGIKFLGIPRNSERNSFTEFSEIPW